MGNSRRHFYPAKEDSFLPLEGDVFGPLHEPGEVAFGLNAIANAEVAGTLFEERICLLLDFLASLFSFHSFSLHINILTITGLKILY